MLRYSNSAEDLLTVACFLVFQEIMEVRGAHENTVLSKPPARVCVSILIGMIVTCESLGYVGRIKQPLIDALFKIFDQMCGCLHMVQMWRTQKLAQLIYTVRDVGPGQI
ncbi:hypothetical protein RND81_09G022000 [Saponaria officinalis]|uniref:Uncharacterized protein n=1 Tax=Saponaria officinalis TaxID=3572 RepID=A0AAW1IHS7_SAPOF